MTIFVVHVPEKKEPEFVEAGYYRIEDGAAVFRKEARRYSHLPRCSPYPATVVTYAAGSWYSIHQVIGD